MQFLPQLPLLSAWQYASICFTTWFNPTSTVTLKKKLSTPRKKVAPASSSNPFLNGILGKLYFSLAQIHSYVDIPEGKSIIISHFRKSLPHKRVEVGSYILEDTFNNLWSAPEVFLKWHKDIDTSAIKELDINTYWISLAWVDNEYCLYTSLQRDSYKTVLHPAVLPTSHPPTVKRKKKRLSLQKMMMIMILIFF